MNEVWAKVTWVRGAEADPKVDANCRDVLADELLLAVALDQAALANRLASYGDHLHACRLPWRRQPRRRPASLHAYGWEV